MRGSESTGARLAVLNGALTGVVEGGVVLLLLTTPLAFGAVHLVSYTAAEVLVFALMAAWAGGGLLSCLTTASEPVRRREESLLSGDLRFSPATYLCGFLVLVCLQVIALPRPIVALLSPRRVATDAQFCQLPLSAGDSGVGRSGEPAKAVAGSGKLGGVVGSRALSLSVYRRATHGALLKAIAYGSLFLLVTGCLWRPSATLRLMWGVAGMGTGVACLGIYQHMCWRDRIYGVVELPCEAAPFGPYFCRNHFAGYTAMAVPIALALFAKYAALSGPLRRRDGRRWSPDVRRGREGAGVMREGLGRAFAQTVRLVLSRALAALCLIASGVMVAAIFMSRSRGGVLAFMASVGVFVAVVLTKARISRSSLAIVGLVVLLLAVGFAAGGYGLLVRLVDVDLSAQRPGSRPSLWLHTFRMWLDFPVTGVGLGCFRHVFPMYKPAHFGEHEYLRSHCDYLQALAEVGLIGGAVLAGFLAAVLAPAVRAALRLPLDRQLWPLVGVLGSCAAILTHSVVDFNLQIPANAFFFAVVLGLVWNLTHHARAQLSAPLGESGRDCDGDI